jgi:hypothetical protein
MIWNTVLPTSTKKKNPRSRGDTAGPASLFCSAKRNDVMEMGVRGRVVVSTIFAKYC